MLEGSSLGRALLEARQKYVQNAPTPLGPIVLKTLAQFVLLGDPSVQPVIPAQQLSAAAGRAGRLERRKDLITNGLSLARIWPRVRSKPVISRRGAPHRHLEKLAREMGLRNPSFLTFHPPKSGESRRQLPKALLEKQADVTAVHLMLERVLATDGVIHTQAVVVREASGEVVSVHQGFSR